MCNDMYETYDNIKLDYEYRTIFSNKCCSPFAEWDYGDSVALTFNIVDDNCQLYSNVLSGHNMVEFHLYNFRYEDIDIGDIVVDIDDEKSSFKVTLNDEMSSQLTRGIYHAELIMYDVVNGIKDKINKTTLMQREDCILRVI